MPLLRRRRVELISHLGCIPLFCNSEYSVTESQCPERDNHPINNPMDYIIADVHLANTLQWL